MITSFVSKLLHGRPYNIRLTSEPFLESNPSHTFRSLVIIWLSVLYLLGIAGFGLFFDWGNYDMNYQDWSQVTGPRLEFLRSAVLARQFPLHISDSATFHSETNRYLSVPDSFISPQYLLLYKLPLPLFNLVNVWILYSAGFAGLLVLKRKLKLSLVSFTILFLLFNFNGNILAHYSVGHTTWGGYFLFPWFVWLVFRLLEGDHSWPWTALMAILLFIIWLQGSYHQFAWLLVLLAAMAVFIPRTFWTILKTGLITCLVCAFRILPAILAYGSYKQTFINGYPSLFSVWDALVNVPDPLHYTYFNGNMLGDAVGVWELTSFVGLLGAVFLIYFGIYRGLLHRQSPYRSLLIPLGIIFLLTLGSIFKLVIALPIPLIQGERVSSRMISVVLVFGIVLAAERFQRWLESAPQRPLSLAGCLFGLGIIGFDLWQDFTIWRVSNRPLIFWNFFNPANWTVKNQLSDSIYIWLVAGGLSVSVLTIVLLGILSWREHPEVHPAIKKAAVVLLHAFVGWGILAAILAFGRKDLAVSSVLIIQLIAAPILFAGIAWIYYSYFGVTTPLQTALFFMGVVMFMHVSVLVFFARNGVNLYLKPVTIWIAFGLVFVVTYLEGRIIQRRAIGKDALLHP